MPLLSSILMDTGSRRIVDRAKGDDWRIPTITVESEDYV
jgi:hypothetical protein